MKSTQGITTFCDINPCMALASVKLLRMQLQLFTKELRHANMCILQNYWQDYWGGEMYVHVRAELRGTLVR